MTRPLATDRDPSRRNRITDASAARTMKAARRKRMFDRDGNELHVTPAGLDAIQPRPMTPEEVADLVERTRAADREMDRLHPVQLKARQGKAKR